MRTNNERQREIGQIMRKRQENRQERERDIGEQMTRERERHRRTDDERVRET